MIFINVFLISRKENFTLKLNGHDINHTEEYIKRFLDHEFIPILHYFSSKGLYIKIPTILDNWDVSFMYKKLSLAENQLGRPAKELMLFLYMRIDKKEPICISQKGLFTF